MSDDEARWDGYVTYLQIKIGKLQDDNIDLNWKITQKDARIKELEVAALEGLLV